MKNPKFIIKEIKKAKKNDPHFNMPISYRVKIEIWNEEIILTREYFRTGFHDGEFWDDFYIDSDLLWKNKIYVESASFMTRNLSKEYLKEKEKELIKIFYFELRKSKKRLQKELKKSNKELNERIELYEKYSNVGPFLKLGRKEKLNSIKNG